MSSSIRFARYFADLPDPRVDRTKWHRLDDILVITLCAVICGADGFEEIERFGCQGAPEPSSPALSMSLVGRMEQLESEFPV